MLKFLVLISVLSYSALSFASEDPISILKRVDELYRSKGSYTQIEMQIITPDWKRTLKMDIWTKGLDYTLVRILSPRKDRGVATLKHKSEMWNFFPKINKVIKVPPSMMMASWMGSDFTNDDLVKDSTLVDDYIAKLLPSNEKVYKIELRPKKNTVSLWGKIIVEVARKSLLPVQQEFYDERMEKIRIFSFGEVKKMGGRLIPTVMEIIPLTENKEGHKTSIKYLKAEFNKDWSQNLFSRTNLEKRR